MHHATPNSGSLKNNTHKLYLVRPNFAIRQNLYCRKFLTLHVWYVPCQRAWKVAVVGERDSALLKYIYLYSTTDHPLYPCAMSMCSWRTFSQKKKLQKMANLQKTKIWPSMSPALQYMFCKSHTKAVVYRKGGGGGVRGLEPPLDCRDP